MFASAIYSRREQKLTLSRDKSGQKPLFYCISRDRQTIVFSSSIRSIVSCGIEEFRIDKSELPFLFLSEYPRPGNSCLKMIKSVKPGTFVTWKVRDEEREEKKYWGLDLSRTESERYPTNAPINNFVKSSIVASVKEEMAADVPVGILLSGGY